MAIYIYSAKNAQGQTKAGMVDARNRETAIGLLKAQNLFVVNIEEKKETFIDDLLSFRGVSGKDLVMFTRQFSTMISAGLQIARTLEILGNQTSNKVFKKTIFEVLRLVEGGSSLSGAMAKYPKVFDQTYTSLIKAGESSGKLDEILQRLATTMEQDNELNSKFKSAMVYPMVVFFAMIGVFIILMVFVIPKLADLYENMNVDLPMSTKIMISISDFMVNYWIVVIAGVFGITFGLRKFANTHEGKVLFNTIAFKFPVFGNLSRLKEQAQFTRTLSLLISAAVPIVEALNIVSNVVTNLTLKAAAIEASHQVEKGNSLSAYLMSSSAFPPLVAQMTNVGEETGKMDEVLEKVAAYYDVEVDGMIKGLSSALEPMILVVLGGMTGFIILSIITPIYKIISAF